MVEHELFWKEAVTLTLIAIFSFTFWNRLDQHSLYIGFILLSVVFYFITVADEKEISKKKIKDYFQRTSSYFLLSLGFFLVSYISLTKSNEVFLLVLLSVAVILFSVGFMRLLFSRFSE